MNPKTNLQGEIRRLDDLIQQKRDELTKLEEIVIKITEPKEVEFKKRKTIDRITKQMESLSVLLGSYGLPQSSRIESVIDFLQTLYQQSQQMKAKRDKYREMIPIAEQKFVELKEDANNKRTEIIDDFNDQIKKYKKIIDLFNQLKSSLDSITLAYVVPLKTCQEIKEIQGYSDMENKVTPAIESTKKVIVDEKNNYNVQIEEIEAEIEKLKKQIAQTKKKNDEAQKLYDESVAREKNMKQIKQRTKDYLKKDQNFRANVDEFCASLDFSGKDDVLVSYNKRIDECLEKIQGIKESFSPVSNTLGAQKKYSYTVSFSASKKYLKTRNQLIQKIPQNQISLYTLTPNQLIERYNKAKANRVTLEEDFNRRKERAKQMSLDAEKRYKEAINVTRSVPK